MERISLGGRKSNHCLRRRLGLGFDFRRETSESPQKKKGDSIGAPIVPQCLELSNYLKSSLILVQLDCLDWTLAWEASTVPATRSERMSADRMRICMECTSRLWIRQSDSADPESLVAEELVQVVLDFGFAAPGGQPFVNSLSCRVAVASLLLSHALRKVCLGRHMERIDAQNKSSVIVEAGPNPGFWGLGRWGPQAEQPGWSVSQACNPRGSRAFDKWGRGKLSDLGQAGGGCVASLDLGEIRLEIVLRLAHAFRALQVPGDSLPCQIKITSGLYDAGLGQDQ